MRIHREVSFSPQKARGFIISLSCGCLPVPQTYNSITLHHGNDLDYSHYKSSVSRRLAARISGDQALTVPEGFGVWVIKESIDSHVESLRMTIKTNREEGTKLRL